jgi:predicted DNA-binding protein
MHADPKFEIECEPDEEGGFEAAKLLFQRKDALLQQNGQKKRRSHKTVRPVWRAVFRYDQAMEVHLKTETEKRLKDLSALSGRATDELVEDAMAGYFAEVQQINETLSSRYDDLKSGKAKPIRSDKVEAYFREKSATARSKSGS